MYHSMKVGTKVYFIMEGEPTEGIVTNAKSDSPPLNKKPHTNVQLRFGVVSVPIKDLKTKPSKNSLTDYGK